MRISHAFGRDGMMGKRTRQFDSVHLSGIAFLVSALAFLAIFAPVASADIKPFEVEAYGEALDVPSAVARQDLEVQAKGGEADIVGDLEDGLQEDFAGIWFEPESGEYVVPLASAAAAGVVGREMAAARLKTDYRTHLVDHSWDELEAAQEQVDSQLREFFKADLVYTSIDPGANATVVHVAAAANAADAAALNGIAKSIGDEVELRASDEDRFEGVRDACSQYPWYFIANCGTPFRGGVEIQRWKALGGECTSGFPAIGDANSQKYVITAGHCASLKNPSEPIIHWQAWDEQELPFYGEPKYLGWVEQHSYPVHDWMKINMTGTAWDTPYAGPPLVAYWQKFGNGPPINAEYPIHGEAASVIGQGVCHSGIVTGGSCGQVLETNISFGFGEDGIWTKDLAKVKGACSDGGDSGGPWFATNIAYGIHIGKLGDEPSDICTSFTFYHEITDVTDALGVHIGPNPAIKPAVETKPAIEIQEKRATLNGMVNPNWAQTSYRFEYGTTTGYGSSVPVPEGNAGAGTSSVWMSAVASDLQPSTEYHYRIVATNAGGTSFGADQTFETPRPAVPVPVPGPGGWNGILWRATDGNIYETHAPSGLWQSYSPTWSKKGVPPGVTPVGNPALVPTPNGGWNGILWRGSDGNIYSTHAPNGNWETYSPTWSKIGIPPGVKAASDPVPTPTPNGGWDGIVWRGSDGNIYKTHAPNGNWETFSPTWSKKGIPSGVTPAGNPKLVPTANGGWTGILWRGSDGNIYSTHAPNGNWETYSPTWSKIGIPPGVKAASDPVPTPSVKLGWTGIVWRGSDGNIYRTHAPNGNWETFSPTWSKKGIPSGVKAVANPVPAPAAEGWNGILWRGSDGNIYRSYAPAGEWETYSPTWSKKGIPPGVTPIGEIAASPTTADGWDGIIWSGSDGNIYETHRDSGDWETYSPTWDKSGLPSGVLAVSSPVPVPTPDGGWNGIMWIASDGNVYESHAPGGIWQSYSPTWSKIGIPPNVTPVGNPALVPTPNGGWNGIIWHGSDGHIYETHAPNGNWETYSPTWSKIGIPPGVTPVGDPVVVPTPNGGWNGIIWRGSDGNIYSTHAPNGNWETYSPTWSKIGIPPGVKPVGNPALTRTPNGGWNGIIWRGSDGNIYSTHAPNGNWETYSPTWSKIGIPPGVKAASDPVPTPSATLGWDGIVWRGSDGNIYRTHGPNGNWETFSPTWSKKGIPSGVKAAGNPVPAPACRRLERAPLARLRRQHLQDVSDRRRMAIL